jgi:hypothetical protein
LLLTFLCYFLPLKSSTHPFRTPFDSALVQAFCTPPPTPPHQPDPLSTASRPFGTPVSSNHAPILDDVPAILRDTRLQNINTPSTQHNHLNTPRISSGRFAALLVPRMATKIYQYDDNRRMSRWLSSCQMLGLKQNTPHSTHLNMVHRMRPIIPNHSSHS